MEITKTAIIRSKIIESYSNFQGLLTVTAHIQPQTNKQDLGKIVVKIEVFPFFHLFISSLKACPEVKIDKTSVILSKSPQISLNQVKKHLSLSTINTTKSNKPF